jgi:RNA polymerase sigma factor for flagellar operon FliA
MTPQNGEADLISRYISSHDPQIREEIILHFIPLVHYILGRLGMSQEMGADYEDLVSQGLLGLIEAIDRFDASFGTQFSTYATLRIRGRVLDYLRSLDWLSRTARQRARSVQNAMMTLWGTLERAPTDEELAIHLDLDLPKVHQALIDSSRVIMSLDTIVESDSEADVSLHELLADENQADPSEILDEEELKIRLISALKALPEREQLVLSLYYYEDLTLKEIGAVLEISESRACQLHARAITSLKAILSNYENNLAVAQKSTSTAHQPAQRHSKNIAHDGRPHNTRNMASKGF